MSRRLTLVPRQWVGWQYLGNGVVEAPFAATPAFVGNISPLKTGSSLLELDLVLAICPLRAQHERARLRVAHRSENVLVARYEGSRGDGEVAITPLTISWIEQHCASFWQRVGWRANYHLGEAQPQEAMALLLGDSIETAATGATAASFGRNPRPFSGKVGIMPFERNYAGLEAWLILRGAVPRDMDDRWFIYTEFTNSGGTIHFRRSWTELLVYQVDFVFAGRDAITTRSARVNLEVDEFGFGTPAEEVRRLDYCVGEVLLGRNSTAPVVVDEAGQASLAEWDIAA